MAKMRFFSQAILCVSDVHLDSEAPERIEMFRRFLVEIASPKASALYILGDLFTAWPGDEAGEIEIFQPLIKAFQTLKEKRVPVYILHGNHDFLLGDGWCQKAGMNSIQDGHILEWHGQKWYLLHGDTLCTDDKAYQAFRAMVRQPDWQKGFLSLPLTARLKEIEKVRGQSEAEKSLKSESIMDVNFEAVQELWSNHPAITGIIHGHTHRPAEHACRYQDRVYTRWVLPDWIRVPGFGVLTEDGYRFSCTFE